ncbi:tail fiber domain-containing protein [Escherichia coli]|nr:tail fiber domain-containing protein [Escherichia coli]EJH7227217.1 tail fiber domain-containing protein [Escherichia coli]EJL9682921.1 tail fiber domain-containing protein [Escherichia coli]
MIYTTGTIAISGNTVTGTGTNFTAPLSLIREGCTLIAVSDPVQIFTITEIKSGTELSVTPAADPAISAGAKFSILLSDSISVDGLAQDVAETLRYYQGKEAEIYTAVEFFKNFNLQQIIDLHDETIANAASAAQSEQNSQSWANKSLDYSESSKAYKDSALSSKTEAESARDQANNSSALALQQANRAEAEADRAQQAVTGYQGWRYERTVSAPNGVEDAKYYPVIFQEKISEDMPRLGIFFQISTSRNTGEHPYNSNSFAGYVRTSGWSDGKDSVFGNYTCYQEGEVSIDSIVLPSTATQKCFAVYVRGGAFPVKIHCENTVDILIPESDYSPDGDDGTTFKVGVENPETECINTRSLKFSKNGFYAIDDYVVRDALQFRDSIGLGKAQTPIFLGVAVENQTANTETANAGIYKSILRDEQGTELGSSQSYYENEAGAGKHTIGVSHNGLSHYFQFHEDGSFTGAKSVTLTPGAGFYADGSEYNAAQLFSFVNPEINTWTGVSRYTWHDDYAISGLIRGDDDTHIDSFGIELMKSGGGTYTHKFYPDGRTNSAQYNGQSQVMGWDDTANWGHALVWGTVKTDNDNWWVPGISWGTRSTAGFPLRATWGLIPRSTTDWPLCSLRLTGDNGSFCNFQFDMINTDITTWSSNGNFLFQKSATSDRDLKHDIVYTDGKESYDRVMQWLPTMFKFNGSDIQRFGLIAQDLLKIDPEYVKLVPGGDIFADVTGINEDGEEYVDHQIVIDKADDTLALDNNVITADLACAMVYMGGMIQSYKDENDLLRANAAVMDERITNLENQVSELVALVKQLTEAKNER